MLAEWRRGNPGPGHSGDPQRRVQPARSSQGRGGGAWSVHGRRGAPVLRSALAAAAEPTAVGFGDAMRALFEPLGGLELPRSSASACVIPRTFRLRIGTRIDPGDPDRYQRTVRVDQMGSGASGDRVVQRAADRGPLYDGHHRVRDAVWPGLHAGRAPTRQLSGERSRRRFRRCSRAVSCLSTVLPRGPMPILRPSDDARDGRFMVPICRSLQ